LIAVLIDADNLSADLAARIIDWCRSRGTLLGVQVFGNFAGNCNAEWAETSREQGFDIVFQPNGGTGKNSTDIALVIRAMDLMHEGIATGFCIASNDRDFVPLASRLRRAGRRVYGVGQALDDRLKANCHDFLELREIPPIVAAFLDISGGKSRMALAEVGSLLHKHAPEIVPTGAGKLRKSLRDSGWFNEEGTGSALAIVLKQKP
jgi:hypothetical protein